MKIDLSHQFSKTSLTGINGWEVEMRRVLFGLLLVATAALSGCGGGNNASNTPVTPPTTETATTITNDLVSTNVDNLSFGGNVVGKLKRWPVETTLIPIKLNGSTQATAAIDLIEATLGRQIFDRNSIANVADGSITNGMIVSMGTALNIDGTVTSSTCGDVSDSPTSGVLSGNLADLTGAINAKMYINIGSAACTADLNQIAIHEFTHALGALGHFEGFGIGPIISESSWDILKTLYNNPVGSTLSHINVYTGVVAGNPNSGTASPAVITVPTNLTPFTADMVSGKTLQYTNTASKSGLVVFNANDSIRRHRVRSNHRRRNLEHRRNWPPGHHVYSDR